MTKVLIADAMKPSLVMSSEIFKDKIPGAEIFVAGTGAQAIELVEEHKPDICLVDFDLPDVDGPALVCALRKIYSGPILMTAFPDQNVQSAVEDELFAYNDASGWVSKPIKFEELASKIEKFLVENHRTGKRFVAELDAQLIAKAAGRGKRAPKSTGQVLNISLGGVCVKLDSTLRMKKKQEITVSIAFPSLTKESTQDRTATKTKPKKIKKAVGAKAKGVESKFKGVIAWQAKGGEVGVQFNKLTDIQIRGLESYLKQSNIVTF